MSKPPDPDRLMAILRPHVQRIWAAAQEAARTASQGQVFADADAERQAWQDGFKAGFAARPEQPKPATEDPDEYDDPTATFSDDSLPSYFIYSDFAATPVEWRPHTMKDGTAGFISQNGLVRKTMPVRKQPPPKPPKPPTKAELAKQAKEKAEKEKAAGQSAARTALETPGGVTAENAVEVTKHLLTLSKEELQTLAKVRALKGISGTKPVLAAKLLAWAQKPAEKPPEKPPEKPAKPPKQPKPVKESKSKKPKVEPAKPSAEKAVTPLAALPLPEFAAKVQQAADEHTHGFGSSKVFIRDVFDKLKKEDPTITRQEFDQRMLEANQHGKLNLSRADLTQLMDPEDVTQSEIKHPIGSTFHFIRAKEKPREQKERPVVSPLSVIRAEAAKAPGRAREYIESALHNAKNGGRDRASLGRQLASMWSGLHDAKGTSEEMAAMERAMAHAGLKQTAETGQTMPFEGGAMQSDHPVRTGDQVRVVRGGWTLPDEKGGGSYQVLPAKVEPAGGQSGKPVAPLPPVPTAPTAANAAPPVPAGSKSTYQDPNDGVYLHQKADGTLNTPLPDEATRKATVASLAPAIEATWPDLRAMMRDEGFLDLPTVGAIIKQQAPNAKWGDIQSALFQLAKDGKIQLTALNEVHQLKTPQEKAENVIWHNDRALGFVQSPQGAGDKIDLSAYKGSR